MNNLSISLNSEPRRYWKSKKKLLFTSICIVLVSLSIFRLWTCRDKTTNTHPQNTILSVGIILTPNNSDILHENLGNKEILFGTSITWDKVLMLANNQIGIHINQNGSISGITIDRILDNQEKTDLEMIGVDVQPVDKLTFISNQHEDLFADNHLPLSLMPLWPFFDGYLSSTDKYGHISISDEKLTIYGMNSEDCDDFGKMYIPKNKTIVALACSSGVIGNDIIKSLFSYSALPLIFELSLITQEYPWKFALFSNDDAGIDYSMILNQSFELDELVILAKQMVSKSNLSTQALTTDDDSHYLELISVSESADISISTQNGSSFIHATTPNSSIHITQANDYTLISNMDFSQTLDNISDDSIVDNDLEIYIDIPFMQSAMSAIPYNNFISSYSKIEFENNDLSLFW